MSSKGLPVRRRLLVLATLSALGGATFLPFLSASSHQSITSLAGFAIVVTIVATLAAWLGLICADRVDLPMPLLRRLDGAPA